MGNVRGGYLSYLFPMVIKKFAIKRVEGVYPPAMLTLARPAPPRPACPRVAVLAVGQATGCRSASALLRGVLTARLTR